MRIKALILLISTLFASSTYAQICGQGKIVDMKEGGWNSDGLAIQLSGPNADPSGADKRQGSAGRWYVFYDANHLSPERLEAIRRIAALAVATGKSVWSNSHTGTCKNATELSILSP